MNASEWTPNDQLKEDRVTLDVAAKCLEVMMEHGINGHSHKVKVVAVLTKLIDTRLDVNAGALFSSRR